MQNFPEAFGGALIVNSLGSIAANAAELPGGTGPTSGLPGAVIFPVTEPGLPEELNISKVPSI